MEFPLYSLGKTRMIRSGQLLGRIVSEWSCDAIIKKNKRGYWLRVLVTLFVMMARLLHRRQKVIFVIPIAPIITDGRLLKYSMMKRYNSNTYYCNSLDALA